MPLLISPSGLRGIVGDGLTSEVAAQFAAVAGQLFIEQPTAERPSTGGNADTQNSSVIVCRDSRPSGAMLADTAAAGLMAVGCTVIHGGIAATPTVGVLVRHLGALGALQITASHNPPEWNGIKVFSAEGRVLAPKMAEELARRVELAQKSQTPLPAMIAQASGGHQPSGLHQAADAGCSPGSDPHEPHLEMLLTHLDAESIRRRAFRVVVDANHGAGGPLATRLLESLGCFTILLSGSPDGRFNHPPEPLEENLQGLCKAVTLEKADVGFALDPDADRLAVVDETGRYIGEEYTLVLAADHRLRAEPGPVVTNVSTTQAVDDVAHNYNCPVYRTRVGEAHVVDKMLDVAAVIGGEGNGGVIDPRIGLVRDAFAAMAIILERLAQHGGRLSEHVARLPRYSMIKGKVPVDRAVLDAIIPAMQKQFPDAQLDRTDGWRFCWPHAWLHLRPSNTEPAVRLLAEAPTLAEARQLYEQAIMAISSSSSD